MSLPDHRPTTTRRRFLRGAALAPLALLAGCVWQPLYGAATASGQGDAGHALQQVYVREVDGRAGQQIRNQLIFLLQGGKDNPDVPYEVRLRVTANNETYAAVKNIRDFTAGSVILTVSYDLFEKATMKRIASGRRIANAPYDRTSQNFANSRAVRDAENRAAREAAEQLRLAIAADLAG